MIDDQALWRIATFKSDDQVLTMIRRAQIEDVQSDEGKAPDMLRLLKYNSLPRWNIKVTKHRSAWFTGSMIRER
jgi:hypothetical protein